MRGKNIIKFFKAVDLLSRPRGATIEEMSENLGVDRRSVYRILDIIEELGLPVHDDKDPFEKKIRKRLTDDYIKKMPNLNVPDLGLKLSEVMALYLLKGQDKLYKGTEIEKSIDSAFNKLGAFFPDSLSYKLETIRTLIVPCFKGAQKWLLCMAKKPALKPGLRE